LIQSLGGLDERVLYHCCPAKLFSRPIINPESVG
jgi:hypothetical protein